MTFPELTLAILTELIRKSGVKEYEDAPARQAMTLAAMEMAANILQNTPGSNMALPDAFRLEVGNPVCFADHAGDFSPTAANNLEHGTPTDGQLTLASLANSTSESTGGRQSAKVDLGEFRPAVWDVHAAFELAATPTAGNVIELWWNPSTSSTAANANVGGCSGSDAAYTGYSNNISASLKQLQFIGDFVCTAQATATVQVARVGSFRPRHRYGSLVVFNKSGAAFFTDDVECHIILEPQRETVQD